MTDTAAREEAVERVRALAEGAMQPHEWGYRDPVVGGFVEDRTPFDLADHVLRLLLTDPRQPSEATWREIVEPLGYTAIFNAIGAAVRQEAGGTAISVEKFLAALPPAPPTGEGGGL